MTAITQERDTKQFGDGAKNDFVSGPVAAATKIYEGAMVGLLDGYFVNVTTPAPAGLVVVGRAEFTFDNTSGAAAAASVDVQSLGVLKLVVRMGTFKWVNSSTTITQAHVGLDCYAVDNQTVALSSIGTRARAGIIAQVDSDGVWVCQGLDSFGTHAGIVAARASRVVRGVVIVDVADLAAFTVASNDGLTYSAGQRVLLAGQTTAAQCGVYVVGTVTSGVAPLTRAIDMATGSTVTNGCVYEVSEGTLWAGSSWKAMCTGVAVVGTNDPNFYPRNVRGILTLASGTYTLGATEGLFLFSVTRSTVVASPNTAGGTTTLSITYGSASDTRVAGKSGTAAVIVLARVAAGSINTADNSTVDYVVTNW